MLTVALASPGPQPAALERLHQACSGAGLVELLVGAVERAGDGGRVMASLTCLLLHLTHAPAPAPALPPTSLHIWYKGAAKTVNSLTANL